MKRFEEKPRWPGAPPICVATNLPTFEAEGDLSAFLATNGPSISVDLKFECDKCLGWHAHTTAPGKGRG